jgi:site-specific DNA recombinase
MTIKNVAVYLRISREQGEDIDTLENHRRILTRLVKDRDYTATWYEEVISGGAELQSREEMRRLLDEIHQQDAIMVIAVDRISRDWEFSAKIAKVLLNLNMPIVTPEKIYDLSGDDMLMFKMMAVMADEELRRTKKRFAMGKHEGILKGQWVQGRPPIGYKRNEETKKLEIIEGEAITIQRIFDLAENNGLIQIVEKMVGYKSRNGKSFNKTSIHRIVHNPIYTGLLKYTTKKGDTVTCEDAHEKIISEELWNRVQENLKQRTSGDLGIRHRNRNEIHSLLSGLVYCSDCGRKMRLKKDSKQKDTIYLNPCECKGNKGVRESLLLATFQSQLTSLEVYFREQWEKALSNDLSNDMDTLVQQVSELTKQAEKLNKRLENLLEMRMDGELTKDKYLEKKEEQEKQLKEVNSKIRSLEKQISTMDSSKVAEGYEEKLKLIGLVKNNIPVTLAKGEGLEPKQLPKIVDIKTANSILKKIVDRVEYKRWEEKIVGAEANGEPMIEYDYIELQIAPK